MRVPETYLGKSGTCPKCKRRVRVTRENTFPITKPGAFVPKDSGQPRGTHTPVEERLRLGERLVDEGIISDQQLDKALDIQKSDGGKLGEILVLLGYIDVKTFADFLAKESNAPKTDLSKYQIPPDLLKLVPKDFAVQHRVFPIDKAGRHLTVGSEKPLGPEAVKELEELAKLRVKALMCSVEDIQNLINEYYDVQQRDTGTSHDPHKYFQGTLKLENVAALLRRISVLPALPDTVQRVREAMEDPEVSIRDIVKIVETDPPVAAKLLAVANSAAYGFAHRVDNVTLAAALLGLDETYMLILSSAVVDTFEKSGQYDYRKLWTNSMVCAQLASVVAKTCGLDGLPGVFAAGLLHDIGRVALMEAAPNRYAKLDGNLMGKDLLQAEREALGITHTEAAFVLASNWDLPPKLVEPMRFHHTFDYAENAKEATAIVAVAATLTEALSEDEPDEQFVQENCGDAMAYLGLDFAKLTSLVEENPFDTSGFISNK